jgi:hypothetical protein
VCSRRIPGPPRQQACRPNPKLPPPRRRDLAASLPAAGGCNDTATIAAIAQLEAAITALNGAGAQVGIFCVDNPGRRRLLAGATLYGSACPGVNSPNLVLPPGTGRDPARPAVQGECVIDVGVSRATQAGGRHPAECRPTHAAWRLASADAPFPRRCVCAACPVAPDAIGIRCEREQRKTQSWLPLLAAQPKRRSPSQDAQGVVLPPARLLLLLFFSWTDSGLFSLSG